jgi:hypothetical protein
MDHVALAALLVTICTTLCNMKNSTFFNLQCFVWVSDQTAIITVYSINLLVFITEDEVCLLRGTIWVFKLNSG